MKVFLDTEFAALDRREPVSIGLAALNGETFYRELDPLPECHEWTQRFVLPLLDASPAEKGSAASVVRDLTAWISSLKERCADGEVTLCFDHAFDGEVLANLGFEPVLLHGVFLECAPSYMSHERFQSAQTQYWLDTNQQQHHALADAKSLLAGYQGYLQYMSEQFKELGL